MEKKSLKSLVVVLFVLISFYSCQVSQYYTATPLKKGEKSLLIGLEGYPFPLIGAFVQGESEIIKEGVIFSAPLGPMLQFTAGTNHKFDYTFGVSLSGQLSYAMKFGLLDMQKSALAIRPEIGAGVLPESTRGGGLETVFWSKIPLIYTRYLGEKSSITTSMGYAFSYPGWNYNSPSGPQHAFLFGSLAYHYGRKNKWVASMAFQNLKRTSRKGNLSNLSTQLAIGYIFHFGSPK